MNKVSQSLSIPFLSASALIALLATGCGRAEFKFESDSFRQLNQTVCAPFDPSNPASALNGLAGSIKYLSDDQARISRVDDLIRTGHDAGVQLILNSLNIPTVEFSKGFLNAETGTPLKRSTGETLDEWFSIDARSELSLMDSDPEGYYQLALLSDDGAILEIDGTSTTPGTKLVDNDGVHATRMGCSSKAIYMKRGEPRSIRVKYYQGPRYYIALTLIWRKVSSASSAADSLCGLGENSGNYFWNSNVSPSAPTSNFDALVSRGWKIPKAQNYLLPADVRNNPCN